VRQAKEDPEYQAQIAKLHASYEAERTVREEAPWLGTTGLDDEVERELPKYLRREFGELLLEADSLKAVDLVYVGKFSEPDGLVHYWKIPSRSSKEDTFAYVLIGPGEEVYTAWGDRSPPLLRPVPN
jgi:hypothetical protein